YRVTVYDLRGHGMSDLPPTNYSSQDMALDLKNLMTALEIQNAHLIGHSFGGAVAVHSALLYPELVNSVVISDTFFPGLKHLEASMNQIPIWKKLCSLLKSAGIDIGEDIDFQRLFNVVANLGTLQMAALKRI